MCSVTIGGRKVHALVDSGADISILSKSMFDKISRKNVFDFYNGDKCTELVSVTGHALTNIGIAKLLVRIDSFCEPFLFQIIDGMKNDVLLGNDFLSMYGVKLDFENKTLRVRKVMVMLKPQRSQYNVGTLVRAENRVLIPAQSMVECPAYIHCTQLVNQVCLVHELDNAPLLSEDPALSVVTGVCKPDNKRRVPIRLINASNRAYTLGQGQVIAYAQGIEESELEELESDDMTAAHFDNVYKGVPYDPLSEARLSHLNPDQRAEIEALIQRNSDLFAQTDADLDRTHLVKMEIDTGDAAPISQSPYRTPFSQRKYVEEQIKSMEKAGIIEKSSSPWASPIVIVGKRTLVIHRTPKIALESLLFFAD
jgi:hypothetical protein